MTNNPHPPESHRLSALCCGEAAEYPLANASVLTSVARRHAVRARAPALPANGWSDNSKMNHELVESVLT